MESHEKGRSFLSFKEPLEKFYEKEDPWDYTKRPDDIKRKGYILHWLNYFGPFEYALDIACGEGWITKDIPATNIAGYEISDNAASRFDPKIRRCTTPLGQYDLIMATGCLYSHYNYQTFLDMIKKHASKFVLTCNIASWEVPGICDFIPGDQIIEMKFPYQAGEEMVEQQLRIFKI